jgi:hypothetical protein
MYEMTVEQAARQMVTGIIGGTAGLWSISRAPGARDINKTASRCTRYRLSSNWEFSLLGV